MRSLALYLTIGFTLTGCATAALDPCDLSVVGFETDFESGQIDSVSCDAGRYRIQIKPENTPINDSPWYAFDITGASGTPVPITLAYKDGTHRYSPKLQGPDGHWQDLGESVVIADDETSAQFSVTPTRNRVRIAAQPIIDTADHLAWMQEKAKLDFVDLTQIGTSVQDRPIFKLEGVTTPDIDKPYVVITGRQHPPEVTGAQALIPFVDTLWGNSELAQRFRDEYNLLVIPLINPDGVANGYWRHNVAGIDLNRDWGPFSQPETKSVETEFQRFKTGRDKMAVFLDFHSTWRNLIYTQTDDEPTSPAFFTRDWIARVKAKLNDDIYSFTREANVTSDRPIAKNYVYRTYGVPAMTFEVGDTTSAQATETAGRIFAEELMGLLLEDRS